VNNVIFVTRERLAVARRRRDERRRAEARKDVAAARLAIALLEGDPCDLEMLTSEAQLALRTAAQRAAGMGLPSVASAFLQAVNAIQPDVTAGGLVDVSRFIEGDHRDDVVSAVVTGVQDLERAVR
jgi:hypothetical protein